MLILSILLDIIGYTIARFLLPIISFGFISVETLSSSDTDFNWFGYKTDGAKVVFSSSMAGWIGLFFLMLLFVLVLAIIE